MAKPGGKGRFESFRYFLKDSVRLTIDFSGTAQSRGVPPPPIQKPVPPGSTRIALAKPGAWQGIGSVDLAAAIAGRRSYRVFLAEPFTLDEISFLLWATQGIREKAGDAVAFRTVPSAGCRHALETYVIALNVSGLERGIYRYLPLDHQLVLLAKHKRLNHALSQAALGQAFVGKAAATFVWSAVPSRMEWRYDLAAHKVIAIDAGHVCQNLYLACSAIGAGSCAVAAYHQEGMDELVGADGDEEFTIYLAAAGKI